MKKISKIKHFLVLGLIFLMFINSFATSVSDNDGSAFITKAEFDALKSSFQAQIDTYNQQIDSKIDGAIASYLAGITLARESDRNILFFTNDVLCMDTTKPLRYDLGYSYIEGLTGQSIFQDPNSSIANVNFRGTQNRLVRIKGKEEYWNGDTNPYPFKKLLVSNVDTAKHIAKWVGYGTDGREHVGLGTRVDIRNDHFWNTFQEYLATYSELSFHKTSRYDASYNVNGNSWSSWNTGGFFWRKNWTDGSESGHQGYIYIEAFEFNNPKITYPNLFVFNNIEEYEFQSNDAVTNTAYVSNTHNSTWDWIKGLKRKNSTLGLTKTEFVEWMNECMYNTQLFFTEANLATSSTVPDPIVKQQTTTEHWDGRSLLDWADDTHSHYPLVQGFESHSTPAINSWSKVYNSDYDSLADAYSTISPVSNAILTGNDGKKHMALTAGFPLLKTKKGETFTYNINIKGTFHNLRLWAKAYPFDVSLAPSAETDKSKFLTLSGDKGATWNNTNKYLKIIQDETTVSFELPASVTGECYVWLKWCADDSSTLTSDEHGIELNLEQTAHVIGEG